MTALESVLICVTRALQRMAMLQSSIQHPASSIELRVTSYNQPMTNNETYTGGCLCGAVRIEVAAPTKWCAHCHCSLCRRAHGAAFVTWFGVSNERFRFTEGENGVGWYSSTPEARRGFCRTCGSTLFFVSENWAGETHIALAHMDGAIDREPAAHVYYDTHVEWLTLDDNLKKLGGASGTEVIDSA